MYAPTATRMNERERKAPGPFMLIWWLALSLSIAALGGMLFCLFF